MAPFGKFPSRAFSQWNFYDEVVDKRFPFWRIVAEGIFEDFTIQYDPENGENWVLVPHIQAEGTGTRRPFAAADGDIEVPILVLNGRSGGSGSFQLFPLRASGAGSDGTGVIIGDGGYGNITLGILVDGSGYTNEKGNGTVTIPSVVVSGYQGALADIILHSIHISGIGISGQIGNGSFNLPLIAVSGTGLATCAGEGSIRIPLLSVSGVGHKIILVLGSSGEATITLPLLRAAGSSFVRSIESADAVLKHESSRRYI